MIVNYMRLHPFISQQFELFSGVIMETDLSLLMRLSFIENLIYCLVLA